MIRILIVASCYQPGKKNDDICGKRLLAMGMKCTLCCLIHVLKTIYEIGRTMYILQEQKQTKRAAAENILPSSRSETGNKLMGICGII